MLFNPLMIIVPAIIISTQLPNRDWRYVEEFPPLVDDLTWDTDTRKIEVEYTYDYSGRCWVYINTTNEWVVESVGLVGSPDYYSYRQRMMCNRINNRQWRACVKDFEKVGSEERIVALRLVIFLVKSNSIYSKYNVYN